MEQLNPGVNHTTPDIIPIKRVLISVSDKNGIAEFAKKLAQTQAEIFSTGKTSQILAEQHIPVRKVEDITGFPEIMNGRVKTLHPKIHGAILGRRDQDAVVAQQHGIEWIDLVVVNLYPFSQVIKKPNCSFEEAIENIDIGGPAMIRAAAKNFAWVSVVVDPNDYQKVADELQKLGGLSLATRRYLAEKAFAHTANYDAVIAEYLLQNSASVTPIRSSQNILEDFPAKLSLHLERDIDLRYGENPHQKASAYAFLPEKSGLFAAKQKQGKPLSYNNLVDAEAAWLCVREWQQPACVIVKHANPCGVAVGDTIAEAYERAYAADPISAFGGIVALNKTCTRQVAESLAQIFTEVIIAPAFEEEALKLFAAKPNLRVLELPITALPKRAMKFIEGGVLVQDYDNTVLGKEQLKLVTKARPSVKEMDGMLFAWRVIKHIKSNAILIANEFSTLGIGAGQVSRIDSVEIALRKAGDKVKGAVLASDAFFPFRDSIDKIGSSGVRAIIQPGGSVRDEEVIAACDEHGIAMVFTGVRCFRH